MRRQRLRQVFTIGMVLLLLMGGMSFVPAALQTSVAAETSHTVIDLHPVGGSFLSSKAFDINATGQVTGVLSTGATLSGSGSSGDLRAFRYSNGATVELGTLANVEQGSGANGINDAGQVVGFGVIRGTDGPQARAFRTAANARINPATDELGTLGGRQSNGAGINNAGQAVGWSNVNVASDQQHAFRTAANARINPATDDLGTLGGPTSEASDINNAGQVVGAADTATGQSHAFRSSGGPMRDLGTLGGTTSAATSINELGQVAGWADTATGQRHAFIYFDETMRDLKTLGGPTSTAADINRTGQVVGVADTATGQQRAFLYNGTTMFDLNSLLPSGSGWVLTQAQAINDRGQIVGVGTLNGQEHAFLLNPPDLEKIILLPKDYLAIAKGALPVKSSADFIAFVQNDQGKPVAGREVFFRVTHGPDLGIIGDAVTDASGLARFTLVNRGQVGTDLVTASMQPIPGGPFITSATSTVGFQPTQDRFSDRTKQVFKGSSIALDWAPIGAGAVKLLRTIRKPPALPPLPGQSLVTGTVVLPAAAIGALALSAAAILAADKLDDLADDPADPNFREIAQPVTPTLSIQPIAPVDDVTPQFANAVNALLINQEQIAGLAEATLISINRAQGAFEAVEPTWEARQMEAAKSYAAQTAVLLNAQPALLAELQAAFQAAGISLPVTTDDMVDYQTELALEGLPDESEQYLIELGADATTLEEIRVSILMGDPVEMAARGGGDAVQSLTDPAFIADIRQFAGGLDEFATSPSMTPSPPPTGNGGFLPGLPNTGDGGMGGSGSGGSALLITLAAAFVGSVLLRRRYSRSR